jgi:hypothetical protein
MDVDVDGFVSLLAARLAAIVPDGFHVELEGDMLWFRSDQGGVLRPAAAPFPGNLPRPPRRTSSETDWLLPY